MTLIGCQVTLDDGTIGTVVAEYETWQNDQGIHHGHRLRVRIETPTCATCPHGGATVVSYRTVDADTASR